MNKSEGRQKINLEGIQILRMLLSLWIVFIHCCNIRNNILRILVLDKELHVPIFLIISFYFFYDKLYFRSINKFKLRIERLLIPYLVYPIINIILNHVFFLNIHCNFYLPYRKLTFFDLIKQLILGMGIHNIFWFQFFLIFLSVFFFIIALLFKQKFLNILELIFHYLLFITIFRLSF